MGCYTSKVKLPADLRTVDPAEMSSYHLPIFMLPQSDIDGGNGIDKVFIYKTKDGRKLEITVVFLDEDRPNACEDCMYDYMRKPLFGRWEDVETFSYVYSEEGGVDAPAKTDDAAADGGGVDDAPKEGYAAAGGEDGKKDDEVKADEKPAGQTTSLVKGKPKEVEFVTTYCGEGKWDSKVPIHYTKTLPFESFTAKEGTERPVVWCNTWNHLFGEKNNNEGKATLQMVEIGEYPCFWGSRIQVDTWYGRGCLNRKEPEHN